MHDCPADFVILILDHLAPLAIVKLLTDPWDD